MPDISRRRLLLAGMLGAASTALPAPRAFAATRGAPPAPGSTATMTITGTAIGTGTYNYHPFTIPPGVNRLDVALTKLNSPQQSNVGIGVFDQRGAHYATKDAPNGFRGIFGQERSAFTITPAQATNAFVPGPLDPGTWTIIVPVFTVGPTPLQYSVTVTLTFGDAPAAFVIGRALDVVNDTPGWYRGDLHCHTQASSDALSSGSAMLPAQWAATCKRIGLDYVALTDHNVVSQNYALEAAAAGTGVLVMAGEEMTNWFWGHATVSGLNPGDWVDWRQLPGEQYAAQGAAADPNTGTIQEFIAHARSLGAFVAAAHPLGATLAWRFFPDAAADPAARTDSLEVWTGPFQPDDQATVDLWDQQLVAGQRIVANGGSDLHGVVNTGGTAAGNPTTVVHAGALAKTEVIAALKAGRSFITARPKGAECYLAVTTPDGAQRQIMGGTVYGTPDEVVTVTVDVRRAGGLRLHLIANGGLVSVTSLSDPDQRVTATLPIGAGGYVRAELHGAPTIDPTNPTAGRLDMEALTNPVWLAVGTPPEGATTYDATQPPAPGGPATQLPEVGTAAVLPAAAAAGLAVAGWRRHRHAHDHAHDHHHDNHGPQLRSRRPAPARTAGPTPMTHTEFGLRAADRAWCEPVVLTGQVTASAAGVAVVSRWVPGCCGLDGRLDVVVDGVPADLAVGEWCRVTGTAGPAVDAPEADVDAHDHGGPRPPRPGLRASAVERCAPEPQREL